VIARNAISSAQEASFRERGLTLTDVLFTREEIEPVRRECDRLYRESLVTSGDDLHKRLRPFLPGVTAGSDTIAAFARHEVFQKLARALLGPDVDQVWNQACLKMSDVDAITAFPFHQDSKFAHVDYRTGGFACFLALAPLSLDNGTLEFAANVHHTTLEHRWNTQANWWECSVEGLEVVPGVLEPGQMVVYHPLTPHGSKPNRSPAPREAFLIAFGPPRVTLLDSEELFGDQRPLLRGGSRAW
jgi:hypothetical protein